MIKEVSFDTKQNMLYWLNENEVEVISIFTSLKDDPGYPIFVPVNIYHIVYK